MNSKKRTNFCSWLVIFIPNFSHVLTKKICILMMKNFSLHSSQRPYTSAVSIVVMASGTFAGAYSKNSGDLYYIMRHRTRKKLGAL